MNQNTETIPAIEGGLPIRESFLDFSRPIIGIDEKAAVMDVLENGWLTSGSRVKDFENQFARYTGVEHSLAVNSCTAALFLILRGMGVGLGHEVITSPNTFPATANVVEHLGAKPVFCDISLSDGNMDVNKLAPVIRSNTKAIIAVHYSGTPCDMKALNDIGSYYEIPVISDSAHAIETRYEGKSVAELSYASAYSFYATKNLTTGEGGMVVTNDVDLYRKMRTLRLHGLTDDAESRYTQKGNHGYDLVDAGYKFNMPDILAALGLVQLEKLQGYHDRRKTLDRLYRDKLKEIEGIQTLDILNATNENAYHLFPVLIDLNRLKCDKNQFMSAMKAENVGVSQHFLPLHLYRYYREKYNYKRGDFPCAEDFGDKVVTLPFNQYLTEKQIDDVVRAISKLINYYKC